MRREVGYVLTDSLGQHLKTVPRKVRRWLEDMLEFYVRQFRGMAREHAGELPSVAHSIQANADELIAKAHGGDPRTAGISCKAGCAHCCRMVVGISQAEAALLIETRVPFDLERAKRQAVFTDRNWHTQAVEDRSCLFLGEDSLCKVYEHRPLSCRKHFVLTEPALCDTGERYGTNVGRFVVWEAEVVTSANFTAFGFGTLPQQLLRASDAAQVD